MLEWEYLAIRAQNRGLEDGTIAGEQVEHFFEHESVLNALGAEGWELISAQLHDGPVFYFKRPRESAP